MRLVTFKAGDKVRPGVRLGDQVLDLAAATAGQTFSPTSVLDIIDGGAAALAGCQSAIDRAGRPMPATHLLPLDEISLLAPIPRPRKNVFCVGSNYKKHVSEASRAQAKEMKLPDQPVFFSKPPTAVIGPGGTVRLDPMVSVKLDYEVELGVVIGTTGRDIAASEANNHIFGFTIINDISARDIQRRHGGQFLKGKGLDTSCPMGPEIVTIDELGNYDDLRIQLFVNGEARQDGRTGDMIFSIAQLINSLSEGMTLEPGDLLATGTPEGVGYAMEPPQFLTDGDRVTCVIEGIGELNSFVREEGVQSSAA